MENTLQTLLQLQQVNSQNTAKSKALKNELDAAKETIRQHMVDQKISFIPIGGNSFVVLKKKISQPSLNDELLSAIFTNYFLTQKQQQISEEETSNFIAFVSAVREKLSSTKTELEITNSRPLASLV